MAQEFAVIVTAVGLAKFADAAANETPILLTEIAIGDGDGATPIFTEDSTGLVHQVGVYPLSAVTKPQPNWIKATGVIPAEDGGFTIREVALKDSVGDVIALAPYPDFVKPPEEQGFGAEVPISLIMEVVNAASITVIAGGPSVFVTLEAVTAMIRRAQPSYYKLNWGR